MLIESEKRCFFVARSISCFDFTTLKTLIILLRRKSERKMSGIYKKKTSTFFD